MLFCGEGTYCFRVRFAFRDLCSLQRKQRQSLNRGSEMSRFAPSAPPEPSQCRICLEDVVPGSPDAVAPCRCKSGQKWRHRECLDRWRATNTGLSLSTCEICNYTFTFEAYGGSATELEFTASRLYRFYVGVDVTLFAAFCAGLWWLAASLTLSAGCTSLLGTLGGARCTVGAAWGIGLLLLLAGAGTVTLAVMLTSWLCGCCGGGPSSGPPPPTMYAYYRRPGWYGYWYDPYYFWNPWWGGGPYYNGGGGGGARCDCGKCNCLDGCGRVCDGGVDDKFIAYIKVAVVLFLAIVGLIAVVFLWVSFVHHVVRRHAHVKSRRRAIRGSTRLAHYVGGDEADGVELGGLAAEHLSPWATKGACQL